MEPQSVSFVQDEAMPLSSDLASMSSKKSSILNVTSGSKTYRITPESGSPPRPSAHRLFPADNGGHGIIEFLIPLCSLRSLPLVLRKV